MHRIGRSAHHPKNGFYYSTEVITGPIQDSIQDRKRPYPSDQMRPRDCTLQRDVHDVCSPRSVCRIIVDDACSELLGTLPTPTRVSTQTLKVTSTRSIERSKRGAESRAIGYRKSRKEREIWLNAVGDETKAADALCCPTRSLSSNFDVSSFDRFVSRRHFCLITALMVYYLRAVEDGKSRASAGRCTGIA